MIQTSVRKDFPLLAKHAGVWEGWYRYINADGDQTDAHRSRLICRISDEMPHIYHQTNVYTWDDGTVDVRDFKGQMQGNKLVFDNDLIKGWAGALDLDENQRSIVLHWERVGEPETYLYEMIQTSDCGQYRSRVWQWINGGIATQRTLIDEQKVSDDWANA